MHDSQRAQLLHGTGLDKRLTQERHPAWQLLLLLLGQQLPLSLKVLVSHPQLLLKHGDLVVPLLEACPLALPHVVELQSLHLENLRPLDELQEGSHVLVQDALRQLILQHLAGLLIQLQALLDGGSGLQVLPHRLLDLHDLVLPIVQGTLRTASPSDALPAGRKALGIPLVDRVLCVSHLLSPLREATVDLDERTLQLRATLDVPDHLLLPVLARLLVPVFVTLAVGLTGGSRHGRLSTLYQLLFQHGDLGPQIRNGLLVLTHVVVGLSDVLTCTIPAGADNLNCNCATHCNTGVDS
mmetsp:Transcript_19/g.132  ORF Transcript_19/g.132 Transcript_19/m.132 type:complete len:297 (-) Transcript_19:1323-2213(-)